MKDDALAITLLRNGLVTSICDDYSLCKESSQHIVDRAYGYANSFGWSSVVEEAHSLATMVKAIQDLESRRISNGD